MIKTLAGVLTLLAALSTTSCDTNQSVTNSNANALGTVVAAAQKLQQMGGVSFNLAVTNAPYFGGSATGSGSYNFVTSQGQASVTTKGQPKEPVIFSPQVLFLNPPAATATAIKLPANTPWIFLDFANPQTLQPDAISQVATIIPGFAAYELANGAASAGQVTDSTPQFSGATHYLVTVSPGRAASFHPPAGSATDAFVPASTALSQSLQAANRGALVTQFDVWVDSFGSIKQIGLRAIGTVVGTVLMTFASSAAVTPAATPSADQTVDMGTLLPATTSNDTSKEVVPGLDGDAS